MKLSEKLAGEQLIRLCFKLRQENDKLKLENQNLKLKLLRAMGDCFYIASFLPKGNSGFGRDYGE